MDYLQLMRGRGGYESRQQEILRHLPLSKKDGRMSSTSRRDRSSSCPARPSSARGESSAALRPSGVRGDRAGRRRRPVPLPARRSTRKTIRTEGERGAHRGQAAQRPDGKGGPPSSGSSRRSSTPSGVTAGGLAGVARAGRRLRRRGGGRRLASPAWLLLGGGRRRAPRLRGGKPGWPTPAPRGTRALLDTVRAHRRPHRAGRRDRLFEPPPRRPRVRRGARRRRGLADPSRRARRRP